MKLKQYLDKNYPDPYISDNVLIYLFESIEGGGLYTSIILKTTGLFKYNNKAEVTIQCRNQTYFIYLYDTDEDLIIEKTFSVKVPKIIKMMLEINNL